MSRSRPSTTGVRPVIAPRHAAEADDRRRELGAGAALRDRVHALSASLRPRKVPLHLIERLADRVDHGGQFRPPSMIEGGRRAARSPRRAQQHAARARNASRPAPPPSSRPGRGPGCACPPPSPGPPSCRCPGPRRPEDGRHSGAGRPRAAARHAAGPADDVDLVVDAQGLERDRRPDRMAAIGEALAEAAQPGRSGRRSPGRSARKPSAPRSGNRPRTGPWRRSACLAGCRRRRSPSNGRCARSRRSPRRPPSARRGAFSTACTFSK